MKNKEDLERRINFVKKDSFTTWLMFAPFIFCTGWILSFAWAFYCFIKCIDRIEKLQKDSVLNGKQYDMKKDNYKISKINKIENLTEEDLKILKQYPNAIKLGDGIYFDDFNKNNIKQQGGDKNENK